MSYNEIWSNFVRYVSAFEPIRNDREKFLEFFGTPAGKAPGFRHRALNWYNPMSDRFKFNCGYRMCVNVYRSCDHGCAYCYVNAYSGGVGTGRKRSGFVGALRKDILQFKDLGMPQGPVHMSNSTDPFQERLEKQYRHTYSALVLLAENRELFSEITLLTKNPGLLFDRGPDYIRTLEMIKDRLNIEISISFFRDNYSDYEPNAPHPRDRLEALRTLVSMGFVVRLRLDPVFPRECGIQNDADIANILDKSQGIQCVIYNTLRLVIPRTGVKDIFFQEMRRFYEGGKDKGIERHGRRYVYSAEKCRRETQHLISECLDRNILLLHCKDTVLVDEKGTPIITKRLFT